MVRWQRDIRFSQTAKLVSILTFLTISIIFSFQTYSHIESTVSSLKLPRLSNTLPRDDSLKQIFNIKYINQHTINIDGNADFHAQAMTENWPGEGTETSPYIISGFSFSNAEFSAIQISNTNLYFQISSCTFIDNIIGINLNNVKNGHIFHNTIYNSVGGQNNNNERWGIQLAESSNNLIEKNTIYKTEWALQLGMSSHDNDISLNTLYNNVNGILVYEDSDNNRILHNYAYNNQLGIGLGHSIQNLILGNLVYGNSWVGIHGDVISDSRIVMNFIYDCDAQAIWIGISNNISLDSNTVYNNDIDSIVLHFCNQVTLLNNVVHTTHGQGISLEACKDCQVYSNTVYDNEGRGIGLYNWNNPQGISSGILIKWNNFIGNNPDEDSQACDYGSNNSFSFNYWDDLTGSDVDKNGIIDENSYIISGSAISRDNDPLIRAHTLQIPKILHPNGGETILGSTTIQWTAVTDSYNHTISYAVYIAKEGSPEELILLESNLLTTHYTWYPVSISSGSSYLIIVVASCFEGLKSIDQSDGPFSIISLVPHNPIIIDGNADFQAQATAENWPGNGTDTAPYLISGLRITSTGPLIQIFRTHLFFKIQFCYLEGKVSYGGGIELNGLSDAGGVIENTIINGCGGLGIYVESSEDIVISKSTIFNNGPDCGINLRGSSKCTVIDNIVYDTTGSGIRVELGDGNADSNVITGNTIYNNDGGIFVGGSNNVVSNNAIYNNNGNGIKLDSSSDSNIIICNNITNNLNYGIQTGYSHSTTVKWNNLIGNGLGNVPSNSPQIMNGESINNIFSYNYFDDWFGADENNDGVIDNNPYSLDGGGEDPHPLVSAHTFSSELEILSPIKGETLNGTVMLQWTAATDSHYHDIFYSIYYSLNRGVTWVLIISELITTEYEWNLNNIVSSVTGAIKVVATCSEGLISESIVNNLIYLSQEVSPPTILYPNGGEVVKGFITIQWSPANDSEGHIISYSLFISREEEKIWNMITSNLHSTIFRWNTKIVPDGSNYLIKVIATCSAGFSVEDISDQVFSINNIPPPPPYLLYISLLAFIAVFPELYVGKKISNHINRNLIGISAEVKGIEKR